MKSLNTLLHIGALLTIVGSFLPWEGAGDVVFYVTNGIRVYLADFKYWITGIHRFPVYDYGGVMVILLTSAILLLAHQRPKFIRNPILWNLNVSVAMMVSSLFFVARWLIHRYEYSEAYGDALGKPQLMFGLIFVLFGSAILLWRAITIYKQTIQRQIGNAS